MKLSLSKKSRFSILQLTHVHQFWNSTRDDELLSFYDEALPTYEYEDKTRTMRFQERSCDDVHNADFLEDL